jgi:cytochrome c peroxidase
LWTRKIEDGFNLAGLVFTPAGQNLICTHVVRRDFPVTRENIGKGWVIDSRLTRLTMKADALPNSWQVALDTHGRAVGDPQGGAFSPDGKWFALAGSGTHEILVLRSQAIPWSAGDPGDFLPAALLNHPDKFRRVSVGGRPMKLAWLPGPDQVVVANYLADALQVVDAARAKVLRTIPLGRTSDPSLERKGEALFYDARRSHNQWFSCHTCHVEGHTCGLNFDTLNDASYGNAKLTPTLRNVANTSPWTWHGWQLDLNAAVEKSLTQTMFGARPSKDDIKALVAFLKTLHHPPHPFRHKNGALSPTAQRGKALFFGKARCVRCHKGANYTSPHNYDVKLEGDGSPYRLWNPPSLLGLTDRGPFLHDGRAQDLEEVLRVHHRPEQVGGQKLSAAEEQDLIAFLQSL